MSTCHERLVAPSLKILRVTSFWVFSSFHPSATLQRERPFSSFPKDDGLSDTVPMKHSQANDGKIWMECLQVESLKSREKPATGHKDIVFSRSHNLLRIGWGVVLYISLNLRASKFASAFLDYI